jgi:hypothetical protein
MKLEEIEYVENLNIILGNKMTDYLSRIFIIAMCDKDEEKREKIKQLLSGNAIKKVYMADNYIFADFCYETTGKTKTFYICDFPKKYEGEEISEFYPFKLE